MSKKAKRFTTKFILGSMTCTVQSILRWCGS